MKRGLFIAIFVIGIISTLCGAALTALGTIGMSNHK